MGGAGDPTSTNASVAATSSELIHSEDIQAEEERMGLTVKVTGIKHRNLRGESDVLSDDEEEDDEFAEVVEQPDCKDDLYEVARKIDPDYQDYYMEEKPVSSMEVTIVSSENDPKFRNHIIVCGVPSSIRSFIKPLRAKYLKEYQLQKVVIITGHSESRGGDQIDPKIWGTIAQFKEIHIVNGSPLKMETLMKANVNYADKVVILSKDQTNTDDVIRQDMIDAEVIFVYKAIRMCNKNVQILTELVSSQNLEFLMPNDRKCNDFIKSPLYAAGEVYSSAIIDTLTC